MIKLCKRYSAFFFTVFLFFVHPFGIAQASPESLIQDTQDTGIALFQRYSNAAQDVLLKGFAIVGTRYRTGGTKPETGLDCSGFVQFVYREAIGLVLPRTAKAQARQGEKVDRHDLKPGDLVFFNTMRSAFSHVGIYLGDDYFLHAPSSGGTVRLDNMTNHYWQGRFDGARRLLQTEESKSVSADTPADSGGE